MPVIGFSSGGFLALQLALDHPDVVRRLVVVGADARISADTRASNLRWIECLRAGDLPGAWRELGTDALADPGRWSRLLSWATSAAALMTTGDCTDGIRTAQSELDFDLTGSLARITAPTLLVAGGRDATLSTGSVMRTARALPHGSLVVLPRTGHLGSLLDPGAVRRIRGFVRGPA
jgi:pimeloyl-ACP methyl ester carboxylesterase